MSHPTVDDIDQRPSASLPRRRVITTLAIGLLIGVLTQSNVRTRIPPLRWLVGHPDPDFLFSPLGDLLDSNSVWFALAFVAGALCSSRLRGILLGTGTLLAAMAGYYATWDWFAGITAGSVSGFAAWILAAFVSGPIAGFCGAQWRRRGSAWALAAPAAFFFVDATDWFRSTDAHLMGFQYLDGGLFVTVGLLFLLFTVDSARSRRAITLGWAVGIGAVLELGLEFVIVPVLDAITSL